VSLLFSPIRLRGTELRNRLWIAPMCQYSCEAGDGVPGDWHLVHLSALARGGAGLVLTEAAAVSPEGRISPQDAGVWDDAQEAAWTRIVQVVHDLGGTIGVQLAHAGRKASTYAPWKGHGAVAEGGWETVAPSALAFSDSYPQPVALDAAGLKKVIADFRSAAERSVQAGFRLIEIHAAHGYLLHQFLSPLSNQRTDTYGGSFENRIRLMLEVVAAVRQVVPDDFPVVVRISATDWTEGGWTADDSVQLATWLRDRGVDLIDASTGGNVPHAKIPVGPGYQVEFAERIRREVGIATGAVGLITTPAEAEAIVANEQADLVLLAREELRDPYFPLRAAHELGADVAWPVQYERAKKQ